MINSRFTFLITVLVLIYVRTSGADCRTFVNTTAIVKINNNETTQILNDCLEGTTIEKLTIKTCVETLETETFKDMPYLSELKMEAVNIKNIQVNFTSNLPKLKYVTITYNLFEEIYRGVFSDLRVTILDLEHNKIARIQSRAFENLYAEVLSLNNNSLRSLESNWFKNSTINNLQVASNRLTWLGQNTFSGIKNLEFLDLPDNSIYYVQDGTFSGLKLIQLDLSENMLTQVDFLTNTKMDYLQIGMNMINSIFLNSTTSIKRMSVYPNPWRCECLRKFWAYADAKNIDLSDPPRYIAWKDEFRVCVVESTECEQYNNADKARKEYFKDLSYSKLQYNSLFD